MKNDTNEGSIFAGLEFVANSFFDTQGVETSHQARRLLNEAKDGLNKLSRIIQIKNNTAPSENIKLLEIFSSQLLSYWEELDIFIPRLDEVRSWQLSQIGKRIKYETSKGLERLSLFFQNDSIFWSDYNTFLLDDNNLYELLDYTNEKDFTLKITPNLQGILAEKYQVRSALCKEAILMKEFQTIDLINKGFTKSDIIMVLNALYTDDYCRFISGETDEDMCCEIPDFAIPLITEFL